jgi:hypothetical protein
MTTDPSAADAVTAFLADVRMQAEDHHLVPAGMVLPLVAAVEAVPALAGKWEKEAARLDGISEGSTDPQQRAAISMRAQAFEECARDLREAVTAALTGPQPGEGTSGA